MAIDFEQVLQANEAALQASQEQLSDILDSVGDVVWSSNLQRNRWFYLNAATEKVLGRPVADFIDNPYLMEEIIHPEDQKWVNQENCQLPLKGSQDLEYRVIWPDGGIHWVRVRTRLIRDEAGNPSRINGIATEVSERRRLQAQLQYDALHDQLTGLANRSLLLDRIKQAIKRSQRRPDKLFAVLFLDLDHFKVVNDSLGHLSGDRFLVIVAHRLQQCQRAEDTIARLGGDEFVILLEDLDSLEQAIAVAERIEKEFEQPIILDDREIFITASIGIATTGTGSTHSHYQQATHLLRDADTAMYRAKASGQGRWAVFNPQMHAQVLQRLELANDLRRALEREEFLVYYQPIICLATEQLLGIEALVRWRHPVRGLVCPADFIPVAEETGLIVSLDRWVLTSACHQLRQWQGQYPGLANLSVSVNLSANHFSHAGLIEFLDGVFQETGLRGNSLKLEVTESAVIQNPESARVLLQELRDRNVQVCLDDFGTGYSSLSYLHDFPFNVLKIDRSFVKELTAEASNREILKAIINLGLTLKMSVIAEGVENLEQLVQLKDFNCPYAQGYWFSQPLDRDTLAALLPILTSRHLSWSS